MQSVATRSVLLLATMLLAGAVSDWMGMPSSSSWPIAPAQAVVGRPMTPVSYAGVARRTARRTAYAESAAVAAPGYPGAAYPAAVPALPPGCGPYSGNTYNCGGSYYRPAYQGSNVVYVPVQAPY
jgi:hypothetical protein